MNQDDRGNDARCKEDTIKDPSRAFVLRQASVLPPS